MQIIQFTPPADEKILEREKIMTARHWRKAPPKVGDILRAQTGRRKDTSFAMLEITDVWEWDGQYGLGHYIKNTHKHDIAKKEGFKNWMDFYAAYQKLNAAEWGHPSRTHYFIEFKLVKNLRENVCQLK